MKYYKILAFVLALSILGSGCVYYNTFYNARKNFNDAEEKREKTGKENAAGGSKSKYTSAIDKSLIVITDHPESKYVDDALYIIGKSYYHLEDFGKAERKFRELLAAYPESDFVEQAIFYLGKSYLKQEEFILARQSFRRVDSVTTNDKWKAEAQYMIGEIEYNERNFEEAIKYFETYLEKYSSSNTAANVQYKIALAYDSVENYMQSKNAYLNVAKYDPHDTLYYNSQFSGGEAYYQIGMIDSGYAIFDKLARNEKYYNSAGEIRLKLAEALIFTEDLEAAIEEYRKIATEFERSDPAARAYFELGEIYMREFSDLETAKTMYDSSKASYRRSDIYPLAAQRSADISKLTKYRETISGEDLENAAMSQFQLAELFLFQLENPDTALVEFQIVIDSFPDSKFAAKAYLGKGYIFEKIFELPDSARQSYNKILTDFSDEDWVENAAEALQIDLDTMEINYPGKRYKQAEKLLFEDENIDSAIVLFQSVIDDFPDSRYVPQAAYSIIWIQDKHLPPDQWIPDDSTFVPDSTNLLAFEEYIETYSGTEYADSVSIKLGRKLTKKPVKKKQEITEPDEDIPENQQPETDTEFSDSAKYLIATIEYVDSLIDTLHVVDGKPTLEGEFIYPPAAYYSRFEGYVGFMVRIDFIGKPIEWKILQSSGNFDIDEACIQALRDTEFNVGEMDITYVDQWQFYRIRIELPPDIRGRQ